MNLHFGHMTKPQVDLGDLQNEKEQLTSFLQLKYKLILTPIQNKLMVESDALTPQELQHMVTKFLYHKNLNSTHYASLDGRTVSIHAFKGTKKQKKPKKDSLHQTAAQSWGL